MNILKGLKTKKKGLYILTHPHKSHFTSGYKLNVYDLVKK